MYVNFSSFAQVSTDREVTDDNAIVIHCEDNKVVRIAIVAVSDRSNKDHDSGIPYRASSFHSLVLDRCRIFFALFGS